MPVAVSQNQAEEFGLCVNLRSRGERFERARAWTQVHLAPKFVLSFNFVIWPLFSPLLIVQIYPPPFASHYLRNLLQSILHLFKTQAESYSIKSPRMPKLSPTLVTPWTLVRTHYHVHVPSFWYFPAASASYSVFPDDIRVPYQKRRFVGIPEGLFQYYDSAHLQEFINSSAHT